MIDILLFKNLQINLYPHYINFSLIFIIHYTRLSLLSLFDPKSLVEVLPNSK